ncbi:MAG: lytic murein transglycosylase [bacterium]|nr:lytic murein transglycosylase [bacterium]
MLRKPRAIVEIRRSFVHPLSPLRARVNLARARTIRVPLRSIAEAILLSLVAVYFIFGSVLAPVRSSESLAATGQQSEAERKVLEQQLTDIEGQISQYESTVANYKKQGKTLQSEIDRLNAQIKKFNLQMKAIEISITKLDADIVDNKTKVTAVEQDLDFNKQALARTLQQIRERDATGLFEVLLKNPDLSGFVNDLNNLMVFQDNLRLGVEKISNLRVELVTEQEALAEKRTDAVSLQRYQDEQRVALQGVKGEKSTLLATTKGQESKYQELLTLSKKTAAQIRAQIFEFLGGGELSFEEALKYARVAESASGVRAAMILAVLDRESALGQNVGKCKYNEVNSRSKKPAMHPTRDTPIFLAITSALAINPDTVTVSCANADGAYGGAMGPAQFIPSTWNLYAKRVGEITGNEPPSPWRNADAFMASALYLKDSGAAKGASISEERRAAARYYAGGRWQRYLWTYGERVVTRAQQFQADIDVLNG